MLTAIIPARGGSKGVKRKNLRKINGETLIEIAVRKCVEVADRVIVSTEDREIFATTAHAEMIKRPDDLAQDDTESVDVLRHAADAARVSGEVLWVQCTAPLAKTEDYRRCVDLRGQADLSVLCHPFHGFVLDDCGKCLNQNLQPVPRRQDIRNQHLIAGSAWAFDVSYLKREMYSGVVQPVSVDGFHCDIDTEQDLRLATVMAEPLYQWMQS